MRSCPKCGARYTDDLRFCLHDGTTLVAATTDDLGGPPTERYTVQTIEDNDPSAFKTLPGTEVAEAETKFGPPNTAKQYSFSAVEPASNLGCTMTFGKVAAALLFVAGLGLAGIIFTYRAGTYSARIEPSMTNSSAPPTTANTNSPTLDPGMGGHSTSNAANTMAASNSSNAAPTPAAARTPIVAASPQPAPTREVTTVAPKATPEPEETPLDSDGSDGRIIRGGQLNGRAISLPKPPYPPAARAVGAGGPVGVRVLVDDGGTVIAANAVSGHPLLRAAAVAAARQARFPPLGRRGVRVTGIITYNFVP